MQTLRQALSGAGRLVAAQSWSAAGAMSLLEATRPLSSLLTLRGFHQQPATAAAAPGAGGAEAGAAAGQRALPPWAPTRALAKRKVLPKRMAHLLKVGCRLGPAVCERPVWRQQTCKQVTDWCGAGQRGLWSARTAVPRS